MPNKLANYTNTPPGGWQFIVPETGKVIGPFTGRIQLFEQIQAYYHTTTYPMPQNVLDLAETQICENHPEACGEPPRQNPIGDIYRETKHTFHAAMQCLVTLISHMAGSGERPKLEQQEKRAQVCVACPKNTDIAACSVCSIKSLSGLIKKISGAKPTSVDSKLKFCEVCHCSNSAKVAVKLEAIANHMPERQRQNLPETCWIVTERKEQEAKYVNRS